MKKRILLTYAMYGNGHRAIAEYIEKYFKEQDSELEIMAIDILSYSVSIFGGITQKVSEYFMLQIPWLWSIVYGAFDFKINSAIASGTSVKLFNNKRIKKIICDFNPDLVISTHFFGSSLVDFYTKKGLINPKLITVVTDYEAHALWLRGYKREKAIIVGDKDEVSALVKKGIPKDKIKPFGIPIKPVEMKIDREKMLKKYGFSGYRPICLFFGGGGNGGTRSLPYIKKLIKSNLNIDFIYVAGKSSKAKAKVDNLIRLYEAKNFKTLGYVNNVPELLQLCDFVVSKPGGAQTTESLYFKRPLLMINCSGGQEKANVKYFERNGYGKYFKWSFSFDHYIKKISDNPNIVEDMKDNMKTNDNHLAMEKLYDLAVDVLNGK